jgi:hypothetical protein
VPVTISERHRAKKTGTIIPAALSRLCSALLFRSKYLTTNYLRATATILLQSKDNNTTVIRLATLEDRESPFFTKRCDNQAGRNPAHAKLRLPDSG